MSNELQIPPMPAYLTQMTGLGSGGDDLLGGISSGAFSRISIKGSRWRLQGVNSEQDTVVNSLTLDVFVADANPNISKNYYAQSYNQQEDTHAAPDCFSDNGKSPSPRSSAPQCLSCAACPHNVWGSKISANGSKTKACQDSKRLAVLLADNPSGEVYELRVPAASMAPMANVFRQFKEAGRNPYMIRWRLSFDPGVEFPKIVFTAVGYVTEAEAQIILSRHNNAETRRVTGKDDVGGPAAVAAPPAQPLLAQAAPAHVTAPAPQQAFAPASNLQVTQPVVQNGFVTPPLPPAFVPPPGQQAFTPAAPAAEKPKRGRKKAEEPVATSGFAAPAPSPVVQFAAPPAVQQNFAPTPQNNGGVVINPPAATGGDIDKLLEGAFGIK